MITSYILNVLYNLGWHFSVSVGQFSYSWSSPADSIVKGGGASLVPMVTARVLLDMQRRTHKQPQIRHRNFISPTSFVYTDEIFLGRILPQFVITFCFMANQYSPHNQHGSDALSDIISNILLSTWRREGSTVERCHRVKRDPLSRERAASLSFCLLSSTAAQRPTRV